MGLLSWLRKLFKRKKATHVITSTAQSRYKNFSIKPTTTEEKQRYIRIRIKPATPITHPTRYQKFFKKRRQPTTARKLWRKNAKLEDD
jgi:hypothetical protein